MENELIKLMLNRAAKGEPSPVWGINSNPLSQRRGKSTLSAAQREKRAKKNKAAKKSRIKTKKK